MLIFLNGGMYEKSLNVSLTKGLRRYIDMRVNDKDLYATPSEYIRDLIRQDMQENADLLDVYPDLENLNNGRFSDISNLKN